MISLFHDYVYSFSNIMFQFNNFWSAFSVQSMCSILGQAKIIELGVSHKEPSTLEESHTCFLNSCNYRSSMDTAKREVGIHCEGWQRKMISDNSMWIEPWISWYFSTNPYFYQWNLWYVSWSRNLQSMN